MQFSKIQLPKLASALLSYAGKHAEREGATVLALSGDLGAGKTALVQEIAKALGVEGVPPSPTFVIMRSYETSHAQFKTLVHIDAYRIEEETELGPLKLESVFAKPDSLVCIEWPEKLGAVIPEKALQIKLISAGEDMRELEAEGDLEGYLQNSLNVV